MAESKKIIFEGIDKGVSSFYDKIKNRAKEANDSILQGAKEQSKNLKEQMKFMEDSIRQIEKQNKLYADQYDTLLKVQKARELKGAKTTIEREEIEGKYASKSARLVEDKQADNTLVSILKELLEVNKDQLSSEDKQRRQKQEEITQINDRWEAKRSLWEQEVKEDEKGVRGKIRAAASSGYVGMSAHERDKLIYQETLLPKETSKKGVFGDVLAANLVTEFVKSVGKQIGQAGSSIAGLKDESNFVGQAYGAMVGVVSPALGQGVQAAKEREEQAQRSRDIARLRARMTTGRNVGAMTDLGLTSAEANELSQRVSVSGGSSRDLNDRTRQLTQLQYGFGLDQGTLLQQESLGRMTGTSGAGNVVNLIAELKRQGVIKGQDYSQLTELINTQNTLVREQSGNQIAPDALMISGIVAEFQKIGGAFGGERAAQRIGQINQSLTSPSDDFSKAQNFAALVSTEEGQGASYFELLKMQSKGISQKGFLGQRLKNMESQFGGGDDMSLAAMQAFGLNPEDAELLMQAYKGSPERFDDMSFKDVGSLQKFIGSRQTEMGSTGVSRFEQQAAGIEEAFAESFVKGVGAAMEIAGKKLASELVSDFTKAFGDESKDRIQDVAKNQKY